MKDWLIEVGLKTFGPSAVRGGILGLAGWALAKNNLLSPFGIISDAVAHTTTIHWDQLSVAVVAALPALMAGIIKLTQHTATSATQPTTPQGDQPK